MQDLLSVIVPVYNVELYIDQCLESLVHQTYDNLEIILVDDGSPDSCPLKCDEWAKKDSRITVIHKKNGGLSDARNVGMERATGKYLAFVDSDDFLDCNMYSIMISEIENKDADVSICGRYLFGKTSTEQYCLPEIKVFSAEEAISRLLRADGVEEAVWDKVYKKELFADISFPVGEINEDIVIMPNVMSLCKRVVHVGKPLYYYRKNEVGISKSGYNQSKHVIVNHIAEVTKYISKEYPSLSRDILYFEARYAYGSLLGLLMEKKNIHVFKEDYQIYLYLLSKNYFLILSSNRYSFKDKCQVTLIVTRLYSFFRSIKNRL